jgi:PIN domain nuclease of toxin-antitoxin system
MRLLIDSNALYWLLVSPEKLSARAAEVLLEPRSARFFSAASVWELEIKSAKGKLRLPASWLETVFDLGMVEIKIDSREAVHSARLPWHHADPFDRLLVAQARIHNLTLITSDAMLAAYGIAVIRT